MGGGGGSRVDVSYKVIRKDSTFVMVLYLIFSGNHEFYRLQAANEDEAVEWMRCIQASIQQDSVYDAFNQRKRRITSVQGLELPGFD